MKTIGKIQLNKLEQNRLTVTEMKHVLGGTTGYTCECTCTCGPKDLDVQILGDSVVETPRITGSKGGNTTTPEYIP